MPDPTDLWPALYEAFDLRTPATVAQRADRPHTPAAKMLASLTRTGFRPKKLLFKGTSGNGKTTELLRVVDRASHERFVVFFDFEQHFQGTMRDEAAMQSVQPFELLFLIGAAVWRGGNELGIAWTPEHRRNLEQAYEALLDGEDVVKVDLAAVASTLTLVVGGTAAALTGSAFALLAPALVAIKGVAKWEVPFRIGGREPLADQDAHVSRLLHAVDALILHVQSTHKPLLLALDGLDRLDAEAADRHFLQSSLIVGLSCAMVVTAPPSMSRRLGAFDEVCTIENVPVFTKEAPDQPAADKAFFHEVWARRAGQLVGALTAPQLDRLAWASGGLLRHFCRLVRGVAERASDARAERVEDVWIEEEIDARRRDLEDGVTREEIDLLRAVAQSDEHRLPDSPYTAKLLREHLLLPYPNQSTWYFPHPLLTMNLVRLRP